MKTRMKTKRNSATVKKATAMVASIFLWVFVFGLVPQACLAQVSTDEIASAPSKTDVFEAFLRRVARDGMQLETTESVFAITVFNAFAALPRTRANISPENRQSLVNLFRLYVYMSAAFSGARYDEAE